MVTRREEKERREQEEYEALKAAFSVEGEGCDAEDEGDEENRSDFRSEGEGGKSLLQQHIRNK